jgi:hypothetical protein
MKIDTPFEQMHAIELYFMYLSEDFFVEALEHYSNGIGYCIDEFVTCGFSSEYEKGDEGYFGESGVKFEIEPPAYDFYQKQIVEYKDFLVILRKFSIKYKNSHPIESEKIDRLMKEIETRVN